MGFAFIILPLLLIAGLVYYLSIRLHLFFASLSKKAWLLIFGTITLLAFLGNMFLAVAPNPVARFASIVSAFWLITILYALFTFLTADVLSLIVKPKVVVRRYLSFGLLTAVMIYGVANAYTLRTKEVTIPVSGLAKPIRAVHLTDIHLGNFRGKGYLEKVVNKALSLNPEVVFHTGDLFDSKAHFYAGTDVLDPFKKINVPHYFVDGNHDEYVGAEQVFELTHKAGVINLQNEIGNYKELQLIGLNNMAQDSVSFDLHTPPGLETIQSVLSSLPIDKDKPTLVLHHRPVGEVYMEEKGADVLLAGHTHGGQMFPFTLIAKSMFTYLKGLYQYKNLNIYVSEGQGTIFVPVRVGTVSEITVVNLVPAN